MIPKLMSEFFSFFFFVALFLALPKVMVFFWVVGHPVTYFVFICFFPLSLTTLDAFIILVHYASYYGHDDVAKVLLEQKGNPNEKNNS